MAMACIFAIMMARNADPTTPGGPAYRSNLHARISPQGLRREVMPCRTVPSEHHGLFTATTIENNNLNDPVGNNRTTGGGDRPGSEGTSQSEGSGGRYPDEARQRV